MDARLLTSPKFIQSLPAEVLLEMQEQYDMIIIGAGISGLAMAHAAKQAGMQALVLEKESRAGGCLHSQPVPDEQSPFWLEMGTHTCFNSYGRLLKLLDALGLKEEMRGREKLRYRLLTKQVAGDSQLASIPSQLHWFELITHAWRLLSLDKAGKSIADYYGALVGPDNYRDLFRHAFNAVSCQQADDMPADMLFRKRPRDKSVMRSYTFDDGLSRMITALTDRLELRTGQNIHAIHAHADGYVVETENNTFPCNKLVCATPAPAASRLLKRAHPEIAAQLAWINEVEIESVAIVVEKSALPLPATAGIIAVDGDFYSAVSRDFVAHPHLRGFTFHFKPGLLNDAEKEARICKILKIEKADLLYVFNKTNRLPAPDMGHHHLIEELDALLVDQSLGLVGNYFNGVAVEDCLERVDMEFARLSA